MAKKKLTASLRWCIVAVVLFLLAGYGVTYFRQQRTMNEAQARIDEMNAQLEQMRLTAAALESDLEFSRTDAYIERLAREELGYVKQGEIKFVEGQQTAPDGENDDN
ncbi:MAG: septum formation initiator family protein [Candidatus Spyradocola sp.]